MPSGFSDTLPDDVLLDTGVLYVGHSDGISIDPIGVTRGGLTFTPNIEMRNIEFDGKRSNIEQLDRVTNRAATISGTFIQFGQTQIPRFEPGVTVDSSAPFATGTPANVSKQYQPKNASTLLAAGNYIQNLRLVYARRGGTYVQIRFPRALCTQYEWAGEDNNEAEIQATFEARLPISIADTSTDVPPYYIEELTALQS